MAVTSSPLLKVQAMINTAKLNFVLDTGASISIIPRSMANGISLSPTGIYISSASGESIKVHGEAVMDIILKPLRRVFTWCFVIADVTDPLLGYDFLSNFGLLIDCKRRMLVDTDTNYTAEVKKINGSVNNIKINEIPEMHSKARDLIKK